jgi:hypothetical protein
MAKLEQGILIDGEGSVQLTSMYELVPNSCLYIETIFCFTKRAILTRRSMNTEPFLE